MSRSKTPTLPWAIPMYQQMQESLHTNLADSSLSPRMHRAIKKGLAKLGHYYDLAKLNHFNIIATSKCLHITSSDIFLTINGSDSLPSSITLIVVQVNWRRFLQPCKGSFRVPPSRISIKLTGTSPTATCVWSTRGIQLISGKHCSSLLVIAPRRCRTQTCIGVWEVCSLWARDSGTWCARESFALVEGE